MKQINIIPTNDRMIRVVLRKSLEAELKSYSGNKRIIEELGIAHGAARVDIAVVNGVIHGYELKSDLDTLTRLPEQMRVYNSVMDKMTLVVGKTHLHQAFNIVPDWWGIQIAKVNNDETISFFNIREARANPVQNSVAVAALLWRDEALKILEETGHANGVRSKTRSAIYERMAQVMDPGTLSAKVREYLCIRMNWRAEMQ